ncbi:MAG: transposase [Glaciimonas sp.]|nr:transposase [Glaciimonas sp.]
MDSPWRDLADKFNKWNRIYVRFLRWSNKNVWQAIFVVLREDVDIEEVLIDSTPPVLLKKGSAWLFSHWIRHCNPCLR